MSEWDVHGMKSASQLYFAVEKPVPFTNFSADSIIEGFCPVCGSPMEWVVIDYKENRNDAAFRTSPVLILDCKKQPACDCPETSVYFTFKSEDSSSDEF